MYMTMFDIAMSIDNMNGLLLVEDDKGDCIYMGVADEGDVLSEDIDSFGDAVEVITTADPGISREDLAIRATTAFLMWKMLDQVLAKHSVLLYTFSDDREDQREMAMEECGESERLVGICDGSREIFLNPWFSFEFDATDVVADMVGLGFGVVQEGSCFVVSPDEGMVSAIGAAIRSKDLAKLNVPDSAWSGFVDDIKLPCWV